jgi:glutathione S-transferase
VRSLLVNCVSRCTNLVQASEPASVTSRVSIPHAVLSQMPSLSWLNKALSKFVRLRVYLFAFAASFQPPPCGLQRPNRWSDEVEAQEAMKRKGPQNMKDSFDLIESDLFVGPFVTGEKFSIADAYLFTIGQWLEADGVDVSTLPKTLAHRELMLSRPAVQRALAHSASK